jgi:SsrA-binding protein
MISKLIATNKKAYREYHILDTCEAGIVLKGSEVKSLRENKVNLKDSYIMIRNSIATLNGVHISAYSNTGFIGHDPYRTRHLLMSKKEMLVFSQKSAEKGYTIIPLKLYFNKRWAKIEIGLAKGKKTFDKRESIKRRDMKRDTERELRTRL